MRNCEPLAAQFAVDIVTVPQILGSVHGLGHNMTIFLSFGIFIYPLGSVFVVTIGFVYFEHHVKTITTEVFGRFYQPSLRVIAFSKTKPN